jgi:hypothetical protein
LPAVLAGIFVDEIASIQVVRSHGDINFRPGKAREEVVFLS